MVSFSLPRLQDLGTIAVQGATDPSNPYNHINCVANAAGFFNNIRTPATLLVIPAINSLWLDLSSTTRRTKHPVAQTLYTTAVMMSILLELVCVFVATVAGTRLLSGGFNPMGPDAVTLLVREFELSYIATSLSFVSGLVTFMSSIGLRAWIQFGDLHPNMGRALTLLTVTFIANMVAYFHGSITHFSLGVPGLIVRFLVLYLQHFGAVGVLSVCALSWFVALTYGTIRDQLRSHGAPTGGLSVQKLPSVERSSMDPPSWRNWIPAGTASEMRERKGSK